MVSLILILATILAVSFILENNQQKIMATQAELAAELRAMKDQVNKVAKEQGDRFDALSAKIADLERIIREGEANPELVAALAEVKTTLNALDETIPDPPPQG